MSADWVNDINRMQTKYGVREWINHATPFQLKKYLEFRLDFIKEEYDETKEALIMEDAEAVMAVFKYQDGKMISLETGATKIPK